MVDLQKRHRSLLGSFFNGFSSGFEMEFSEVFEGFFTVFFHNFDGLGFDFFASAFEERFSKDFGKFLHFLDVGSTRDNGGGGDYGIFFRFSLHAKIESRVFKVVEREVFFTKLVEHAPRRTAHLKGFGKRFSMHPCEEVIEVFTKFDVELVVFGHASEGGFDNDTFGIADHGF